MAWDAATPEQIANLGMGANPFLGQANPYLQQNIDAASQDLVNNYNLTTQPAFNRAMANSGSFGNAGVAQMNADAQSQLQKNLGNLSNNARMQDYNQQQGMYQWQQDKLRQENQWGQQFGEGQRQYNQNFDESKRQWQNQFDTGKEQWNLGFDRSVYNDAYSQNMNNLTTGMGLLGSMYGYTQNDLANANAQQNAPMDYWKQFSNQANVLGGGGSTSTSQTGSTSNPWASAIGGAMLGQQAWNAFGGGGGNTQAAWTPQQAGGAYGTQPTLNNNMGGGTNYFSGGFGM